MSELLWVGLGGFLGANARYLVNVGLAALLGVTFPWATLLVNVTGSFVLGVVLGLAEVRTMAPAVRLFVATGILGGYTTFSSFSYETLRLAEHGTWVAAGLNVAGNVLLGLIAALGGLAAGRSLA